jgi:hypothetical protein
MRHALASRHGAGNDKCGACGKSRSPEELPSRRGGRKETLRESGAPPKGGTGEGKPGCKSTACDASAFEDSAW